MTEMERQHLAVRLKREDDIREARKSVLPFTTFTKDDYKANWHHVIVSDKLNKFLNKEIKRLMLFMPPQNGKSELGSRRLPALIHGRYPQHKILAATYNSTLASDITLDVERIIDSEKYHRLFPHTWITPEGSSSRYKRNSAGYEIMPVQLPDGSWFAPGGSYRGQGIDGSFTGRGAKWIIVDDPLKNRKDADSASMREDIWNFWKSTLRTRLAGDGSVLIIMTRWHEDDLAGRLLDLAKSNPLADQWEVINFEAIREDTTNSFDPRGIGEPLWPEQFPMEWLQATKAGIGSREWTSLYQQRPSPEGGNIIRREWMQSFYSVIPGELDTVIQSWDLTFKDSDQADFVVGQVWGKKGAKKILLDQVRARMNFTATMGAIESLKGKWPMTTAIVVEEHANGAAVIDALSKKVPGLIPWRPKTSKVARAQVVAPQFEAGNVDLPDPSIAPWIHDYIEEWMAFPAGKNDDQVDATTQALIRLDDVVSYDWSPVSVKKQSTWKK